METPTIPDTEPKKVTLPPEHPLAGIIGIAKNEPLWEMLWEEIYAVRERINQEERDRDLT